MNQILILQNYFKTSLKWALILSLALCLARIAQKKTDGFTLASISSTRSYDPKWQTRFINSEETEEIKKVLSQRYCYFSCGGQSFVFLSDDDQYVIKFFKQRVFLPSLWLNLLPLPKFLHRYREKKNWKRQDKLLRDFTSYKIAFEELQEETGVLFIHLNPTQNFLNELTIKDKIGIVHKINLDKTDFILQRKAELVYDRIHRLMNAGKQEEAKQAIFNVLHLVVSRCKKGYHDRDPNVRTNCGFIGEKAIKVDVGRLMKQEAIKQPEIYKKEFMRIALPFQSWIEQTYPELSESFAEILEKVLL